MFVFDEPFGPHPGPVIAWPPIVHDPDTLTISEFTNYRRLKSDPDGSRLSQTSPVRSHCSHYATLKDWATWPVAWYGHLTAKRFELGAATDRQGALVKNFAAQAVIRQRRIPHERVGQVARTTNSHGGSIASHKLVTR